jgi:DNA-binding NtrC family response regulator
MSIDPVTGRFRIGAERWQQRQRTVPNPKSLPERVARFEQRMLLKALDKTTGNLTQAAVYLGITYRAARYLAAKHLVYG